MRAIDLLGLAKSERFELRRTIGEGETGVVYEAFDRDQGAVIALKMLRRLDAARVDRFEQEFRALLEVRHPNLVTLGELLGHEGEWFFTMELVDGVDFMSFVCPGDAASRAFDEAKLRVALLGLASGLRALHAKGKVHRDLKPSNVLVTREGRVVLLDFGLIDGSREQEAGVIGTLGYMAPEQAAGRAAGPAADWYAVGLMLYEALTGRPAFDGGPLAVLRQKIAADVPPAPSSVVPGVPPDLDVLCMELLEPDPRARLAGAEVVARLAGHGATRARAPFVGRDAELAALRAAWDRSRRGRPSAVLVHGDAGVGKTALVRELLVRLVREGEPLRVFEGRCRARGSAPYEGVDGVVEGIARHLVALDDAEAVAILPPDAAILARMFAGLRRAGLVDEATDVGQAPIDPFEARKRAFRALRELLARLVARGPVAVLIDDFQWADGDARALVRDLIAPPGAPRVLLLVVSRAAEDDLLPLRARRVRLDGPPEAGASSAPHVEPAPAVSARAEELEEAGEIERAAAQARDEARAADEALAFERAAALYRAALRLDPGDRAASRPLRVRLGHALANAGHAIEAAEAWLDAAGEPQDAIYVECTRNAAALFLSGGDVPRGVAALDAVLAERAEKLPATKGRALASMLWHRLRLPMRGLKWRETAEKAIDPRALDQLDTYHAVATSLALIEPVAAVDFQTRALALALDLGEPRRVGRALALEAIHLATQGSAGRARSLAGDVADLASRTGDAYLDAIARVADGVVAYHGCEPAEAAALLGEAVARFQSRTAGTAWEVGTARTFQLAALAEIGLFAELGRLLDESLHDAAARGDRYTEATLLRMFNVVWLARGEPAEARRRLDVATWTPPPGTFHQHQFLELMARVDLDLYEGNAATTRERLGRLLYTLEHSLLMRLPSARAAAWWGLARLALAEDDDEAADAYVRKLEREGLPTTAVCALLLRATLATRDRDDAEALGALDEAIAIADAEGFLLWAAVGRRRRGELVGGDDGSALFHEADLWMEGQGIRSPARFAAFVIPPFRSHATA